jgi:hypothetical protein
VFDTVKAGVIRETNERVKCLHSTELNNSERNQKWFNDGWRRRPTSPFPMLKSFLVAGFDLDIRITDISFFKLIRVRIK